MSKEFIPDPVDYSSLIAKELTHDWETDVMMLKELRQRNREDANLVRAIDRRLLSMLWGDKRDGFEMQVCFEVWQGHKEALQIIAKGLREVLKERDIRGNAPKERIHKFEKDQICFIQSARRVVLKVDNPHSEFLHFATDYFRCGPHWFDAPEDNRDKMYTYRWEKSRMERFRPVPDEADYLFTLGSALIGHGLYSYAVSRFKEILNRDPWDHETLLRIGRCYKEMGLYEFAIHHLRRAVSIMPKDGRGCEELGDCYLEMGLDEPALENLLRARDLGQGDWGLHNNIGVAYARMEKHGQTVESYAKAAEVAPEIASIRRNLGLAYGRLGQFDKAIEAFEKYAELDPENHDPHVLMGDVYEEMGDFSRAAAAYEKAIQIRRDYWVYIYLGRVYEKLDRADDARASYQEALKIPPWGKEARAMLFELDHPDMEDLKEEMDKVVREHPFLKDDLDAIPVIYEEAKRRRAERERRQLEGEQTAERPGLN